MKSLCYDFVWYGFTQWLLFQLKEVEMNTQDNLIAEEKPLYFRAIYNSIGSLYNSSRRPELYYTIFCDVVVPQDRSARLMMENRAPRCLMRAYTIDQWFLTLPFLMIFGPKLP